MRGGEEKRRGREEEETDGERAYASSVVVSVLFLHQKQLHIILVFKREME